MRDVRLDVVARDRATAYDRADLEFESGVFVPRHHLPLAF